MNDVTPLERDILTTVQMLQTVCHTDNNRWWKDPRTGQPIAADTPHLVGEKLMLIVSEIAEGMEGHRKNLNDEHLPQFRSLTIELVDALIRIFDLAGAMRLNLADGFVEKRRYNATRKDHTHEARLGPGGKTY